MKNAKNNKPVLIAVGVIAVLILLLSSVYTVRQNQYVVIRQW